MGEYLNVQQIRGLGSEVARQYLWEALVNPPAAARAANATPQSLLLRCMSTSLPEFTTEPSEIMHKSSKIIYAGKDGSGKTLSVVFFDTEDLQVYKTFFNWVKLTTEVAKVNYESNMTLKLLNRAQDTDILSMTLSGCYPESLQETALDYGGSEPLNINVTLRYDYITLV